MSYHIISCCGCSSWSQLLWLEQGHADHLNLLHAFLFTGDGINFTKCYGFKVGGGVSQINRGSREGYSEGKTFPQKFSVIYELSCKKSRFRHKSIKYSRWKGLITLLSVGFRSTQPASPVIAHPRQSINTCWIELNLIQTHAFDQCWMSQVCRHNSFLFNLQNYFNRYIIQNRRSGVLKTKLTFTFFAEWPYIPLFLPTKHPQRFSKEGKMNVLNDQFCFREEALVESWKTVPDVEEN